MIDVQTAARGAVAYCEHLFGNVADRFLLEEVELSEDQKHWFITVGFDDPLLKIRPVSPVSQTPWTDALRDLRPNPLGRQYKVVTVDAETGNIQSVKIRQPLERIS